MPNVTHTFLYARRAPTPKYYAPLTGEFLMATRKEHAGQLRLFAPAPNAMTDYDRVLLTRTITATDTTYSSCGKPHLATALRSLARKKIVRLTLDDGNNVIAQGPPRSSL